MEFTALRILLWDDDDDDEHLDLDVEFLEDLYACWSGLKVNDIRLLVSMALLDVILVHMCSTTPSTDFRKQGSGHILE